MLDKRGEFLKNKFLFLILMVLIFAGVVMQVYGDVTLGLDSPKPFGYTNVFSNIKVTVNFTNSSAHTLNLSVASINWSTDNITWIDETETTGGITGGNQTNITIANSWADSEIVYIQIYIQNQSPDEFFNYTFFTVDLFSPPVTDFATDDLDGNVTSSTSVKFNVTASDATAGLNHVTINTSTVYWNLTDGTGDEWHTTNTTAQLGCTGDVNCTFQITAVDNATNRNDSVILVLSVDDLAPAVTNFAHNDSDGNLTSSSPINISVDVEELGMSGLKNITINTSDTWWNFSNVGGTTYWTVNTTSDFGCTGNINCTLQIQAFDNVENVNTSVTFIISVDDLAADVNTFDVNQSRNVTSTTSLNFTVTIADLGMSNISTVTVNGSTMDRSGTTFWNASTTADYANCPTDGTCTFTVIATDNAGNINDSVTLALVVDDTAPTIAAHAPADLGYSSSTSAVVSINVTDTGSGMDAGHISIASNRNAVTFISRTVTNGSITNGLESNVTVTGLKNGDLVNITVNATDSSGNSNTNTFYSSFTVDTATPNVTSFTTDDGDFNVTSTASVNFSVTIADAGGAIDYVTINTSDTWWNITNTAGTTYWTVNTTADFGCTGTTSCVFQIQAFDQAANSNLSETITLEVDDVAPNVTAFAHDDTDGNVTSSTSVKFNASVIDLGNSGIGYVTLNTSTVAFNMTEGGAGNEWSTTNTTAQFGCTGDVNCTFQIRAFDNVSNENDSLTLIISVDDLAPSVAGFVVNDTNNNVSSADSLNFNLSAEDLGMSGLKNVSLNSSGTDWNFTQGTGLEWFTANTTADFGCTADQLCTFQVQAYDNATNANTSVSLTLYVDDSPPAVTNFAHDDADGNVTSTTSLKFNVTAQDVGSGGTIAYVTLNTTTNAFNLTEDIGNQWNTTNTTSDFGCTGNTDCLFQILAYDGYDRLNDSSTLTLSVDDLTPAVTAFAHDDTDGNVTSTTTINISVDVSELGSAGIKNVTINTSTVWWNFSNTAGDVYWTQNTTADFGCTGNTDCTFQIWAYDNVLNVNNSVTMVISVDDLTPAVTSFTHNDSDGNVTSTSPINISVDVSDLGAAGIKNVTINTSTVWWNFSNTAGDVFWTVNTTSDFGCTGDVNCTFQIQAYDDVLNVNNSVTMVISVDDFPPSVTSFTTDDNNNNVTSTTSLNFTVQVDEIGMSGLSTVTMNGSSMEQSGTTWWNVSTTADYSCGTDQNCTFQITATDVLGQTNSSETLVLTVDDLAEGVSNFAHNDSDGNTSSTVQVRFNVSVLSLGSSGISHVTLNTSGVFWNLSQNGASDEWNGSNTTGSFGATSAAGATDYIFQVTAYDNSGNANASSTFTITVDDLTPELINWTYNSVTKNITLTFNKTMDASTVSATADMLNITDAGSTVTDLADLVNKGGVTVTTTDTTTVEINFGNSQDDAFRGINTDTAQVDVGAGLFNDLMGNSLTAVAGMQVTQYTDYAIRRPSTAYYTKDVWSNVFTIPTEVLLASTLTNFNVTSVLTSIDGNYNQTYAWNTTHYTSFVPGRPINSLSTFNISHVNVDYYVYMNATDRIEIE